MTPGDYSPLRIEKVSRWVSKPSGRGGRSKVMYEARLGDLHVDGATATEAKTKMLEVAASNLAGDYTPVLLRHGEHIAFIFRVITEVGTWWNYTLVDPEWDWKVQRIHGIGGHASAEEAEKAARSHLAQNTFEVLAPTTGLDLITDPADRARHLSWATFQVRYKALDDADYEGRLHETASGLDRWPGHIAKPADLIDPALISETRP